MWPDGARCAASFTFDFDAEEVWIGEDPENAHRPGVLSQGTYGAKVAVPAPAGCPSAVSSAGACSSSAAQAPTRW